MEKETDNNIVKKCVKGDKKAFEILVGRYEKPIYNIAYRVMHNDEDAMDITQNTFMKVYEKLETFDASRKFFSWLYRIAVNEVFNYNKMKRFTQVVDRDIHESGMDPEERYAKSELHRYLQSAIRTLKFDYKIVVILKHFQGLSYKEISEILEIPEKTVKSRLFTARQLIKDKLIERGYAR